MVQFTVSSISQFNVFIHIQPPDVCSYQVINYNITANSSTTTYQYPTITGQMTQLNINQHLEENAIYTLAIKVWEKYRESIVYITNVTFGKWYNYIQRQDRTETKTCFDKVYCCLFAITICQ